MSVFDSIFLAKLLGLWYLIVALAVLVNIKSLKKMLDNMMKSPALMYVTGIFMLLLGIFLVLVHNVWVYDWTVLITISAWAALIKGVFYIVLPDATKTLAKSAGSDSVYVLGGLLMLVLGGYLSYMGFFYGL